MTEANLEANEIIFMRKFNVTWRQIHKLSRKFKHVLCLEWWRCRLSTNKFAYSCSYGINKVFQGNVPDPSYFPSEIRHPICVLDSGINSTHPDLANIKLTSGDGQSTEDCEGLWHGTVRLTLCQNNQITYTANFVVFS